VHQVEVNNMEEPSFETILSLPIKGTVVEKCCDSDCDWDCIEGDKDCEVCDPQ